MTVKFLEQQIGLKKKSDFLKKFASGHTIGNFFFEKLEKEKNFSPTDIS